MPINVKKLYGLIIVRAKMIDRRLIIRIDFDLLCYFNCVVGGVGREDVLRWGTQHILGVVNIR